MTIDTSFVDNAMKVLDKCKGGEFDETYPLLIDNEASDGEISDPGFYIINVKTYSGEETR